MPSTILPLESPNEQDAGWRTAPGEIERGAGSHGAPRPSALVIDRGGALDGEILFPEEPTSVDLPKQAALQE